jgi:hypothetical protein
MDKILAIFCFLVALGFILLTAPDGIVTLLVVALLSFVTILLFRQYSEENQFLTQVFLAGLILRLVFGICLHVFEMREFFGGDAFTYDFSGQRILDVWFNNVSSTDFSSQRAMSTGTPGWGMNYLTALIYMVVGRNILAAQSFCAVIGAATAPMAYLCAHQIFQNKKVSKVSALLVALFPAFIIWSGQLLKDGLIIFLLLLAMTMVLQLQRRLSYAGIIILIFSLFGILSLRFYIFYMVAISVAGSFVIGQTSSVKSIARSFIVLVGLGLALTYLGVLRTATENFDKFGNLESVQRSRDDLARSGESGFGSDLDVSTTEGAITAIPVGLAYLLLAPFPWEVRNVRQAITLPEILIWWAMMPLLVYGLWYTLKNRLRNAIPVLIFTLMLTIAYSIFQGNVGTAYRQRTQIQVFLFIFIAVGWTLIQENKENKKNLRQEKRRRLEKNMRDTAVGETRVKLK